MVRGRAPALNAGSRARWYCPKCVQHGNGERFRSDHTRACGGVEAVEFAESASTPAPNTLEGILNELRAAEASDALRLPELDFVRKALAAVASIDVSNVVEGSAPMHPGVNAMFQARGKFIDELFTEKKMTEVEAAMAALMVEQGMSQNYRDEWCKFMTERGFIAAGAPGRMSAERNTDLVPSFKEFGLNTGDGDVRQFGELVVLLRDITEVVWSILCNPAFCLATELATDFEEVFDEDSVYNGDVFRGGSFPEVHNSLWFKVLRLKLPGSVLPIAVFLASDATNLVSVGTRSGHGLYLVVVNLRTSARVSSHAIQLLGIYMPPKHGAGDEPARVEAVRARTDEYFRQARDLVYQPLRDASKHGVLLPLPLNGHTNQWTWRTCFIVVMGEGGDLPERYHLACSVCGSNAEHPCPKCHSTNGSALRNPVEARVGETAALQSEPRKPRDAATINAAVERSQLAGPRGRKNILRHHWSRGVPLLTNVPGFDAITSLLIDVMHTLEGVTKRLLQGAIIAVCSELRPAEAARRVAELNYRLQACRAFCGPRGSERLPPANLFVFKSDGTPALRSMFTAREFAAACPHLPLVFAPWPALSKLFQAWAMLYTELRSPMPTWARLRRVYDLYQHFLRAFDASTLGASLKQGIDTPKVHDILHLVHQILLYGCADNVSLQQMERAHILWMKRAFKGTDKRLVGFEACMMRRIVLLETERLVRQLRAQYYAVDPSLQLPRSAVDTWRRHAGMAAVAPPCPACAAAAAQQPQPGPSNGQPSALAQCRPGCPRALLRRTLRGEGRRSDLPSRLSLQQLQRRSCKTLVGACELHALTALITSALNTYSDVIGLVGGTTLQPTDVIVPYTSAMVRGAGRDMCVSAWATARPASNESRSVPTFDFVALAEKADREQDSAPASAAADEVYGLLALVFTCSSVDKPLCLLQMLRRAPLSDARYVKRASSCVRLELVRCICSLASQVECRRGPG